jgi:hypothetical protein
VTPLDTVFAEGDNQDPFWLARRAETLLIGLGCNNPAQLLCTSTESGPFHTDGLDALQTDHGGEYLIELLQSAPLAFLRPERLLNPTGKRAAAAAAEQARLKLSN